MKKIQTILWGVIALVLAFTVSSCGSVVKKPAINKIKSVAIISIASPDNLINIKTNATYRTSDISSLATAIGQKSLEAQPKEVQDAMRAARDVTEGSAKIMAEEMGSIKGWSVKPYSEFLQSADYKNFKERIDGLWGKIGAAYSMNTAFDNTMPVIPNINHMIGMSREKQMTVELYKELCQKLGVDGVAVVNISSFYEEKTRLIGSSGAIPTIHLTVGIYNSAGKIAVDNAWMRMTNMTEAKITTSVVKGFIFDDNPKDLYLDAVRGAAQNFRDLINQNL